MLDRRDLIKLSLGAALAKGADGHKFFTNDEQGQLLVSLWPGANEAG